MYIYLSVRELKKTAMKGFEKLLYLTGKWKVEIRYKNLQMHFQDYPNYKEEKHCILYTPMGKNSKGNMREKVQAAQMKALSLKSEKE